MGKFYSTKTFDHSLGLSACFRQWKAALPPVCSRCSLLHGYALSVKLVFGCETVDERHWVQNFGGLKEFKQWLVNTFDHKTLVAQDDPELEIFKMLHEKKIIDLVVLPSVGCERFAELCFIKMEEILRQQLQQGTLNNPTVYLESVEVSEHGANSAIYVRD